MQDVMQTDFGVFRTEEVMITGLEKLHEIEERMKSLHLEDRSQVFNTSRLELLELDNMLNVAISTAKSALFRQESRGAHSRQDYQDRDDDNWHCHTIDMLRKDLLKRPVDMTTERVDPIPLKEREQ